MTRIILPLMALFTGFFVVSCDDEADTVVKPGLAQFEKSELSFFENSERATIVISFNKQASDYGEVRVQVSSSNVDKFQFVPVQHEGIIHLPFSKGQSQVSFEIFSTNNDVLDGDKTLDFTILSVSRGYNIGTHKTLATTCVDDERPARAEFFDGQQQIREDKGSGELVAIILSPETKGPGVLRVSIQSSDAIYGTHFITEPPAVDGIITIHVQEKKSLVSFIVSPINDGLYNASRSITYSIAEAEGGVEKGEIVEHNMKIIDDELGEQVRVTKSLRAAGVIKSVMNTMRMEAFQKFIGTSKHQVIREGFIVMYITPADNCIRYQGLMVVKRSF